MSISGSEAILAALPEPALMIGQDGVVTAANPAAKELFGAHIVGVLARAHLRQPEVSGMIERVLDGLVDDNASFVTAGVNAETTWRATARRVDAGAILVSLRDVSDLEAAEAQRRDFVANVSHELRGPLTVLAGFIETLQGPAADDREARTEFLGIMAREAERMTGLVADLLSLSRVEANAKIRPRNPVAMDLVVHSTLAALRPQIEAANIVVICDLPEDLPSIPGDHDQLVQVYHNLIENAVKYGAAGGKVSVNARVAASVPGFDGPVMRLTVRDFGEGIDPIHIPRLTERFYRVDRARSRDTGGTGLGLAICKHILGRHRGRLTIRSVPGEGATFETILPCQ